MFPFIFAFLYGCSQSAYKIVNEKSNFLYVGIPNVVNIVGGEYTDVTINEKFCDVNRNGDIFIVTPHLAGYIDFIIKKNDL